MKAPPLGVHSVASVTIVPLIDTEVSDPENPVPDTVTVSPTTPVVGERVMIGVVSVNVAVALSKLPSVPVAFTMYGVGDASPLIVRVQLKLPKEPTVAPHAPIVAPGVIVIVIPRFGVKPVPTTPTERPLGPSVGVSVIAGVVMVKNAVALSKLPSAPDALTVYGDADAVPVILAVQLNFPDESGVVPQTPMAAPLVIARLIAWPGENPVPETRTETPLGPWVGVRVIAGVVIVKGAMALSKVPSDPVAVTVYAVGDASPLTVAGQLKFPVEFTVAPHAPIVAPPSMASWIVAPGVNPIPDATTETPLGPCVGVRMSPSAVMVNGAEALSKLPSTPCAVIVYVVTGPVTMNVQSLNVPTIASVGHEAADPMCPLPSIVNVIVPPGVNPLPDAVTVTPLGPWVGTSVSAGTVIVNGAVPRSKLPSDPVAVIE